MTIRGKVAGLVDSTMVAINVGSKDGVRKGDEVQVYRQVNVKDPDSKEELGSVILTKVNLKVNYVDVRFSVAETVGTVSSGGIAGLYTGALFNDARQIEVTTNPESASSVRVLLAIGDPVFVEHPEPTKPAKAATRSETPKPENQPKASTE